MIISGAAGARRRTDPPARAGRVGGPAVQRASDSATARRILGALAIGLALTFAAEGTAATETRALAAAGAQTEFAGSRYRILTYKGGTEIEFVGYLMEGASDAVQAALTRNPQARVIHLNSFGGLSFEGWKLFELIRRHNLATYTSGWCYSACTYAFLGGRERWIARGARLGFHQPAAVGADAADLDRILGREGILLGSYIGLPADFVSKAQSTPHDSMWLPTFEELSRANVITGVAEDGRFAPTGFGDRPTAENVGAVLVKMSPFDSVRHLDATAFEAIRDLWLGWFTGTRSWDDVSTQTRLRLERVFEEHVGMAADAAVIQYAAAVVAQMEAVRAGRPDVCVALVVGDPAEALEAADAVIPYKLQQDRGAAYDLIFSTAAEEPQAPPRERQVGYLFDRVIRALWRKHGERIEIMSRHPVPTEERAAACEMYLAYFREILARDPDESGRMLRWLYGMPPPDKDLASAEGPAETLPAIIPRRRERK